ncbi:hypothetical protein AAY473_032779 [Plecturocebus cupreus]
MGWARWLTPVIPAFWEAKTGKSLGQEFETSLTNMGTGHKSQHQPCILRSPFASAKWRDWQTEDVCHNFTFLQPWAVHRGHLGSTFLRQNLALSPRLESSGARLAPCNLRLPGSRFHQVGQAGLELLTSGNNPPTSASQSVGIIGMRHHTWPWEAFKGPGAEAALQTKVCDQGTLEVILPNLLATEENYTGAKEVKSRVQLLSKEAETQGLLEPRRRRLRQAEIVPVYSSLDNRVRVCLRKKK